MKESTPTISTGEREVTAQSTACWGSRRQREGWGKEAAWGLLRGVKLSFLHGLKAQLEQKQECEA